MARETRAPRLAAHAVGPPARPARPLPARHRDRGHRARPRPRRALERADAGQPHLLGGAAFAAGGADRGGSRGRASAANGSSPSSCTTRRNTSSATSSRRSRRCSATATRAWRSGCWPPSTCASACRVTLPKPLTTLGQDRRPRRRLPRSDAPRRASRRTRPCASSGGPAPCRTTSPRPDRAVERR